MFRRTRLLAAILAIALCVPLLAMGGAPPENPARYEGPGFDSPQDAARAYLAALGNQNLSGMVSCFAIESLVDAMDFKAMLERLNAYSLNFPVPLPNTVPYARQLNIESRKASLTKVFLLQFMQFQVPEILNDLRPVNLPADEIEGFTSSFENGIKNFMFAGLNITGEVDPAALSVHFSSEANQKVIAMQAAVYGIEAEDLQNVVISFEAGGYSWYFCAAACRLNGKWYLESPSGSIGAILGLSATAGGIMPAIGP